MDARRATAIGIGLPTNKITERKKNVPRNSARTLIICLFI
jgi:hypothetical protein